eukprot:517454_1
MIKMADPDTTEHHETISGGFNLSIQKRVIRDAQCGLKGDQSKHPLDQQAATSLNTITDDDQQEIQFDHDEYDDAMCANDLQLNDTIELTFVMLRDECYT